MGEKLNLEFKNIDAPPEEAEMLKQNQANLKDGIEQVEQKLTEEQKKNTPQGVFGGTALVFLEMLNKEAGAEPIKSEKIQTADGKDLDEMVVEDLMSTGNRLDQKYLSGAGSAPDELRFGFDILLLELMKGRINRVFEMIRQRQLAAQQQQQGQQQAAAQQNYQNQVMRTASSESQIIRSNEPQQSVGI